MRTKLTVLFLALAFATPALASDGHTRNVAIVLYDGVEVLDFAGPAEVFAAAANFGRSGGKPAFNVYTVAISRDPIVSQGFLDVTPDFAIEGAPKPDIIVIPGGSSGNLTRNEKFMAWLAAAAPESEVTLTVCTGAFVLADAGLLDDRDATTWYRAVENLRASAPKARVHAGRRFVDSGNVITTAGVSAGIDGSLHTVARLLGRRVADRTAEYMEYHWTPEPYLAMEYSLLNPSLDEHGRAVQQAAIALEEGHLDEAERRFADLTAVDSVRHEALEGLGRVRLERKNFPGAMEAFVAAAENADLRARSLYNAACAAALAHQTDRAIALVEQAIAAGFRQRGAFDNDRDFDSIRSDARFQAILAKL